MKYFRLGDIAPIEQSYVEKAESYWLLNLDKIESNTGKITEYNYVAQNQLKGAIISFDTSNVLYSKLRPYLNKVVVPKMPGYATSELLPLRPNKEIIDKTFLAYFLRSPHFVRYINEKSSGAKMPRAKTKDLLMTKVPCPEIDAQKKIVKKFSRLEKVINCKKEEIQLFDELIKARFVEIFGDPKENPNNFMVSKLKDVSLKKISYGSGASSTQYNGTVRYIRITDIKEDGSLNNEIKSPETIEDKYYLNDGDILFARTGATVGKTYRYRKTDGKAIYAGYLIRMIPNIDKVLPDYVFYFTKTDYYKYFIKNTKRTVAQPNINSKEYGDLLICVPPLELQRQFVNFVNQVDKSKYFIFRIQACYNIFIQIDFNSLIF